MKYSVTVAILLGLASANQLFNNNERVLQAVPPPPPPPTPTPPAQTTTNKPLKYYGTDISIAFNAKLGCGACITSGYTYCIQGKEGDDYSGKTLNQKCCQTATASACPEINDSTWTCSNTYADKILAKNICPYRSANCGAKNVYRFSTWGDSTKNNIQVSLASGDTCSIVINTQCGVPAFTINSDTTGFNIETVDYADDETSRRMLFGEDDDDTYDEVYDEDEDIESEISGISAQFTHLQAVPTKTNTTTTTTNTTNTTKTNTTTTTTNTTKTNTTTTTNSSTSTNTTKTNTTTPTPAPTPTPTPTPTPKPTPTPTPVTPLTPLTPPTPAPVPYVPPPPPAIKNLSKTMNLPRRQVTTSIVNGTAVYSSNQASQKGPQASVYDPSFDKGKKIFKGGVRSGDNDYTCKSRNTRLYITALNGQTVTVPASVASQTTRILQSTPPPTPTYSMSVTVQSDYWASGSLYLTKTLGFALVAIGALLLAF